MRIVMVEAQSRWEAARRIKEGGGCWNGLWRVMDAGLCELCGRHCIVTFVCLKASLEAFVGTRRFGLRR